MSRPEPDLRPVGWALAARAFVSWLALRVTYVIAAVIAAFAAGTLVGFLTDNGWAVVLTILGVLLFFAVLAWFASRGPRPRDEP